MKKIKILIADDENDIRMLLRTELEEEKYEVLEASNGEGCMIWLSCHFENFPAL